MTESIKQVVLAELGLSPAADDVAASAARAMLREAVIRGMAVCFSCGKKISSVTNAFFLDLEHPVRGPIIAMACCELCLQRAKQTW